ncbi:MAG: hypothetical protein ACLS58_06515 [Sutterella wadsworthensis]
MAILVTQIAAAAAGVSWMLVEWMLRGRPSLLGLISGAVGGLVVITPASGFVGPVAALVMGLIGGVCCFWGAVFLKRMAGWDDSLDAFGVHGVGGIVGALLTGVFASSAVTGSEMNPVMTQVGIQAASVVATMVYASAVSWILLKIIDSSWACASRPTRNAWGLTSRSMVNASNDPGIHLNPEGPPAAA